MLEGQLRLTGLNREIVDAFVEEIVVYAKDRVEIKWKLSLIHISEPTRRS